MSSTREKVGCLDFVMMFAMMAVGMFGFVYAVTLVDMRLSAIESKLGIHPPTQSDVLHQIVRNAKKNTGPDR